MVISSYVKLGFKKRFIKVISIGIQVSLHINLSLIGQGIPKNEEELGPERGFTIHSMNIPDVRPNLNELKSFIALNEEYTQEELLYHHTK